MSKLTQLYGASPVKRKILQGVNPIIGSAIATESAVTTISSTRTGWAWSKPAYGNGRFVAVANGTNYSAYSTDGKTWVQTPNLPTTQAWDLITFGAGIFIATSTSVTSGIAATSTDGVTWTQRQLSTGGYWTKMAYANGIFVGAMSAYIHTSTDGISWTYRASIGGYYNFKLIAFNGSLWMAINENTGIYTSPDGITWTSRTIAGAGFNYVNGLIAGNGLFVVTGSNYSGECKTYTSPDGITWTLRTTEVIGSNGLKSAGIYTNGYYYFFSGIYYNSAISKDGITWKTLKLAFGDGEIGAGTLISLNNTSTTFLDLNAEEVVYEAI